LRLINGKSQRGITPWPEYFKGDFSRAVDAFGKPITLTDPITRAPFPDNQIPTTRFDPVAVKLAAFYPAPNLPGSVNNLIVQGNATTTNDSFAVKVDHELGSRDRLTASAFWRPNTSWDPVASSRSPLPIFGAINDTLDLLSYVRYLRTISATMFI